MVIFKAAHFPTTPHTSATPVEPVFTALWFFPSFSSFSDSLANSVRSVVLFFVFSFSEQETKVAPETLSHWDMAELPHWYTPLTGLSAAFWKGHMLASTQDRNPARPWGSPPILLVTSEHLVDPDKTELGCFFQATSLCLLQPPRHFLLSLESETWAEPALAGWQFLLICDRFLDK